MFKRFLVPDGDKQTKYRFPACTDSKFEQQMTEEVDVLNDILFIHDGINKSNLDLQLELALCLNSKWMEKLMF